MQAVITAVITIEVTSKARAHEQVGYFVQLLNSYAEIDAVVIKEVRIEEEK